MVHLPHGGGRQPPGRPGAALGSWVVTRGGKSSRWYIFPMEEAGSRPVGPEQPWGAGWSPGEGRAADGTSHEGGRQPPGRPGAVLGSWVATKGGKSSRWYIFPMEEAGSRPAGPEQPWGAGWPPREGRAADGTSSLWRRPAVARPARSCPGELGGHHGRGEQTDVPSSTWRQPPGRPGAALGSWWLPGEERADGCAIFPMEEEGSHIRKGVR